MSLNSTPMANRIHIGIFGRRNSGKSSLINALVGQDIAMVSPVAGTTTDPVYKTMEINPIGPVVFIDTAGFDDMGELGEKRVEKAKKVIEKTDVALLIFEEGDFSYEKEWLKALKEVETPVIAVVNKKDSFNRTNLCEKIRKEIKKEPYLISAFTGEGLEELKVAINKKSKEEENKKSILGGLVKKGDKVLLVMPQDIQAPKGRLILPQVQTIRELLDDKCIVIGTTSEQLKEALEALKEAPDLIITDSQCFQKVYEEKPQGSKLTSFSVLFAALKGDIEAFVEGAKIIGKLGNDSKVLIAEACTHAPLEEDIGRVKIPAILRKKNPNIHIDVVAGADFPKDISDYDLIIHCGACMFNRKHVMTRVNLAKKNQVPITNYGIAMASFADILGKIEIPRG